MSLLDYAKIELSSRVMCVIAKVYRMVAHEETFATQEFLPMKSIRFKGLHYRKCCEHFNPVS